MVKKKGVHILRVNEQGTCIFFSGKIVLFVVNHPAYSDIDYIEKFEYKEKDQSLEHIHSYTDDAIRV